MPVAADGAIRRQPFDGRDRLSRGRADGVVAGFLRHAIDVNGASPAHGNAAAVFGPGEKENVSQNPKHGGVEGDIDLITLAVDVQGGHTGLQ